ncbi:thermonuclease family protein [Rhizobium leucaenae]|uniref:Endonuclease YncB(Thermonuclease family) n=1 Tax=Rhizobium leucaenae TaxID=29450 RepID=A0A7W7ELY2_9HYPH|nr:thermonuclease family protein [Rhizobium leucaenae]MBB4570466.1 endonuclease YncB(thermonuclease family) [Rhizobium leucaenae]MBB6303368.1 endonuclease YncB(thermonuclease family) [Rhizobium leucaenae]
MAKAKRHTRRKPQPKAGNSMWLWGMVGLAAAAGIFAYEHRRDMPSLQAYTGTVGIRHVSQDAPLPTAKPRIKTAAVMPERPASSLPVPPNVIPVVAVPADRKLAAAPPETAGRFGLCGGETGINCVVDGNTFWQNGIKIRLADIDVPDIEPSHCAGERQKATAAKLRLQALLNNDTFVLSGSGRGDDQHGGKFRIAMRAGRSIGDQLVAEGLARRWTGQTSSWCS